MGSFVNKLQSGKEKFFLSRYECYGGTATDGLADWLTGTFSKCWVEADGFTADSFFCEAGSTGFCGGNWQINSTEAGTHYPTAKHSEHTIHLTVLYL